MNRSDGRRALARSLLGVVALSIAGIAGCSPAKDRAPPVSECVGCGRDAGNGGALATGGRGSGNGGAQNAAGGRAGAGAGMSGSIRVYADKAFQTTSEFSGAGIVGLTGSSRVTGTFEAGTWSVSGAGAGAQWADLHATSMGQDALDTLQVLDDPGADLVFASRAVFDEIVTGLSSVQSVNPDFAQIVLKFLNGAGQPVAGVVVAEPTATVAYDAGSSYTDATGAPFGATQGRGIAIVLNYRTASAFPGGPSTLQYVKPGESNATPVEIRAAIGAVSFRNVVVN